MNLQAKSAASPCGAYGYSYQYRSDGIFEAGCRQRTTAAWAVGGRATLAPRHHSTALAAESQVRISAFEGVLA